MKGGINICDKNKYVLINQNIGTFLLNFLIKCL